MACPANSYKTNRGGARRIREHFRKVTRTYKYRHAKTLRSKRFKAFYTSLQNKINNSKWNNYLVSPAFLIAVQFQYILSKTFF